jgi:hypothetical protein
LELELPRLLAPDLPSNGFQQCELDTIHYNLWYTKCIRVIIFRRCLASISIGQFARLLLTVVMVAVSQAPSPESNPNSPLPVNGKVVNYTTFNLIGGKFIQHRAKKALSQHSPASTITTAREGVGFCFGELHPAPHREVSPSVLGKREVLLTGISDSFRNRYPIGNAQGTSPLGRQ